MILAAVNAMCGFVRLRMHVRLAALSLCAFAVSAQAQVLLKEMPEDMKGADIHERRGETLPLDLEFLNSSNEKVRLGDCFDGKRPVVLIFGYLDCPMLCDLVFTRAQRAFNQMDWTMGDEYRVLTISFDHQNTPAMAAGKKAALLAGYGRATDDDAWEFLVTDAATARAVTDAAGYQYRYLANRDEYSHPAALVIVSPDGVISNYLINSEFPARQVRLSLLDAADGKVGGFFDGFLHRCYIYDPDEGSYVLQAKTIMNIAGGITVVVIATSLAMLICFDRRRRAAHRRESDVAPSGAVSHA